MNIYISAENEKLLRQEKSMSGLVNRLLEEHFKHSDVEVPKGAEDYMKNTLANSPFANSCEHGAGKGFCKVQKCKNSYLRR